jgi:multimeric flavodoxin WrbA
MANILNILNANMINSEGAILLSNFFDDQYGTLDLRGTSGGNCGLANCTTGGIQVNLLNTAAINNSIMVTATTGENIIDGAGHGTIRTGDAYAGLNMVNVANTNFVDSRYLMVSLNAFSNVNGDIVFPALASFFNTLNPGAATQHITNSADVDNDVSVTANTGNNNATTASSTITTGDAISTSNVFNNINTNLSGGNTLHILLRVHGEWVGDIFGATGEFEALRNNSTVHISNGSSGGTNNTAVHATNTSVIRNNVNVTADTGHNEVRNASSSTIDTGDAYAAANILNVANANVIGKNWMLAIINIFGDFNGNVSFGRPDLWVGEQIHAPSKIENGTELEYKFTVINNGDLAATQVRLRDTYHEKIDVVSSSHAYTESNGTLEWHIGTLPPGGATEITYRGQISGARPGTKIENTVRVSALEPDNNMSDNTDSAYIWTAERVIKVKKEKIPEPVEDMDAATSTSPIDVIQVTRTTQSSVVKNVGMKAPQELIIVNPTSHTIKSVVLRDAMKDPSGAAVQTEEWILGDVLPHEEIKITYDIQFGSQAEPGAYMLSTTLIGSASTTKTLALNGVVNLLAPEVIAEVFLPKKAEASVNTTTSATIEAEEEPDPTPVLVDTTEQLASAADTGFDFNPLWLVAIGIGSIAVVGRKKMYQWLFL